MQSGEMSLRSCSVLAMLGIGEWLVNQITYIWSRDLTPHSRMLPQHKSHVVDIEQGGPLKADHKPAMQLSHRVAQWMRYDRLCVWGGGGGVLACLCALWQCQ